jgi:phospholipid/cholesterol/gamma-HCH transport system permease protein
MKLFGWIGRFCIEPFLYIIDLTYFLTQAFAVWQPHRKLFNRAIYSVLLGQLIFTGVDAFAMISFFALAVGVGMTSQLIYLMNTMVAASDITAILSRLLISEIGPLITGVILIGRSCSAMAVDLGNTKVRGEIEPLEYLGVNVDDYFVVPRIICMVICQFVLALYFSIFMLVCGVFFSGYIYHFSALESLTALLNTVSLSVAMSFMLKNLLFGFSIGAIACYHGLSVDTSPTQVPQQMQKAVVMSMLFLTLIDGYFLLLTL